MARSIEKLTFLGWLGEYAYKEYTEDYLPELLAKREEIRSLIARIQQEYSS